MKRFYATTWRDRLTDELCYALRDRTRTAPIETFVYPSAARSKADRLNAKHGEYNEQQALHE